jgi:hypothetical protein
VRVVGDPNREVPYINVNAIARRCTVAVMAAAFAAAPLLLSAVSHADPEPDPPPPVDLRLECENINVQGVFSTMVSTDGVTHSVCQYIVEGYFYYDLYDNGVYTGTLINKNGEKTPIERPEIPPFQPLPKDFPLTPYPGTF